uniref:Uncharacterized protein n=1 Tax=Rhodocyclus tenuis TaxID=1066 RepID=A0A840GBU3_RHOTE|nr:hypothetical protein [Rhodocyclus tenuis]
MNALVSAQWRAAIVAIARLRLALRYARALGYTPRRAWASARRES